MAPAVGPRMVTRSPPLDGMPIATWMEAATTVTIAAQHPTLGKLGWMRHVDEQRE